MALVHNSPTRLFSEIIKKTESQVEFFKKKVVVRGLLKVCGRRGERGCGGVGGRLDGGVGVEERGGRWLG